VVGISPSQSARDTLAAGFRCPTTLRCSYGTCRTPGPVETGRAPLLVIDEAGMPSNVESNPESLCARQKSGTQRMEAGTCVDIHDTGRHGQGAYAFRKTPQLLSVCGAKGIQIIAADVEDVSSHSN
jgi:hypothetical protein